MQDDVFTIALPGSNLVFTRYLFIKEEVRIALLFSILNKDEDDALYWGFELYWSGFKWELIALIWKIYYDFFATLNSSFAVYLQKNVEQIASAENSENNLENSEKILGTILMTLCHRPFNTDVFMARNIADQYEMGEQNEDEYRNQMFHAFNRAKDTDTIITMLNGSKYVTFQVRYIASVFVEKHNEDNNNNHKCKKKKKIIILANEEDVSPYRMLEAPSLPEAHLPITSIDKWGALQMFQLTRHQYPRLMQIYHNHWLYHASFSPIWSHRLRAHRAYADHTKQCVCFMDEDLQEEFFEKYNLEPDEQPTDIQQKSMGMSSAENSWKLFYEANKGKGVLNVLEEELEMFEMTPY
jgi:hypothetical protein